MVNQKLIIISCAWFISLSNPQWFRPLACYFFPGTVLPITCHRLHVQVTIKAAAKILHKISSLIIESASFFFPLKSDVPRSQYFFVQATLLLSFSFFPILLFEWFRPIWWWEIRETELSCRLGLRLVVLLALRCRLPSTQYISLVPKGHVYLGQQQKSYTWFQVES